MQENKEGNSGHGVQTIPVERVPQRERNDERYDRMALAAHHLTHPSLILHAYVA